eukprot:gene16412-biopygen11298
MGIWRRFWRPLAILKIGPRQNSKNMGRQHGRSASKNASREQKKSVPGCNGGYLGSVEPPWCHMPKVEKSGFLTFWAPPGTPKYS